MAGKSADESRPRPLTTREWLESPDLVRLSFWVARRYELARPDAEDLLQEVRLALLLRQPELPANISFLFRVASHKAVDMVRGKLRDQRIGQREGHGHGDSELVHLLNARVSGLPVRLRDFCRLRYERGMNRREIAALLGVGRSSVRWLEAKSE